MGEMLLGNALFGKKNEPPPPPPRTMTQEGMDTINTYRNLAPPTLDFLNEFGPQYQKEANNELAAQMGGTADNPGSLGLFEHVIAPTMARTTALGNTAQREADVSDVERLGGRATAAIKAANPQQAKLLDLMNKMATDQLAAGSKMTPDMQREVQQSVRSGQAARGMGFGQSDLFDEALTSGTRGQQLLQSRQNYASGVAGLNQQAVGDPFMAVVGRQSMVTPYSQSNLNAGQAATQANKPNADPFTAYAGDLYNTNFNAAYSNLFSQRNNDTAKQAALMQMIGSIVGGASGAAGAACWVARELFGWTDGRWLAFRGWLLGRAPAELRELYLAEGPGLADWLRGQGEEVRGEVRGWMEAILRKEGYGV